MKSWKFLAAVVMAVALIAGGTVACDNSDDCDASGTTASVYAPAAFEQPVNGRSGGTRGGRGGGKSRSGSGKSKTGKSRGHGSTYRHHDDDCEDDD